MILKKICAEAMRKKRAELQAQPLDRIYEDLVQAVFDELEGLGHAIAPISPYPKGYTVGENPWSTKTASMTVKQCTTCGLFASQTCSRSPCLRSAGQITMTSWSGSRETSTMSF